MSRHGRRALALTLWAATLITPAAWAAPAPEGMPDPRVLDEMARDLARFTEAVQGYRTAARDVIKRAYLDKMKAIRAKYEPLIAINEKEEKERRLDAIAVLEAFLRKYPSDKKWTPDVMFRLAELYYEKSSEEFLATQEQYQKLLDSPTPPTAPPPKADYTNTVNLYRKLLTEFPNYRLLDATYYLLGFCLGEMGQDAEAKQALLALTCANRYKPLDPPPPAQPSTGTTRGPLQDFYKDCTPVKKDSKFLPEGWTRVGEMHFDGGELALAISAYGRVLEFKDSAYYDKALYKLAWSYYRDNRFPDAIREFDNLIKWADEKKASGDKFGSDLRPEAVQYLAISFAEPDWDGDTVADTETGLQRAQRFFQGRENEPHVKEIYQRLGDIFFDSTKYAEAIAVYKHLLEKWPNYAENPKIQEKVVRAHERDRNLIAAAKEREVLGRNYAQDSEWWKANKDNPDALAAAQQLAEDALLTAATNIHANAQACRTKWLETKADAQKLEECLAMYRTAAELYEKYLAAYPNSKRAYEFSFFHADAHYYGGNLPQAINAYTAVRDSNLDNRYQAEAAIQVVKAYEELIEQMKREKKLEDPPIPDEKNTQPPVAPIAVPDIYRKYVEALDWYVMNMKDDRVPDLRYAAAVVLLRYRNWPEARARLSQLGDAYCTTKPEIGYKSYSALLTTYFIDYNVKDEELQDCALGRLLQVADQFTESACAKAPQAAEHTNRIRDLRASVKSQVITKRLNLALENEEKGTARQLAQCREGSGGIALVTGAAPAAPGAAPATGSKVSTEVDISLALDLIDLVNQNPKDQDSPSNLNNACVIYEKLYQFGEATKCYERLARDYPDHALARDAFWNATRNQYRFFEFDKAVNGYLRIATDPKFADYEHRKTALGLAAQLLDNDQQYVRAADFYKKYAAAVPDKPQESAQAYFFSCNAFEKAKDVAKQRSCLQDFVRQYRDQAAAGEYVVQGYMKLAEIAEKSGNKKATLDAYKKVRDEFIARKLPPATPAAGAAAKAEYLMAEDKFEAFKAKRLVFGSDPKQVERTFNAFVAEAKALSDEYAKVWDYKDATWTLASFLKRGDIYFEFSQKLLKIADNPPDDVKAIAKKAERLNPGDGDTILGQFKDAMDGYIRPTEDEAKKQWRATLERAAQLGVTNEYVKKARENLSRYLPEEFPFIKDERIAWEAP